MQISSDSIAQQNELVNNGLRYLAELIIATALVSTLVAAFHAVVNRRTRNAILEFNQVAAENAMQSFLESAVHDQPVVQFAQNAFRALSGELVFIDARIEKTITSGIPTYDLKLWNTALSKDLPHVIEIGPRGVAVKFEHPGIWYEMVFTSRRGYGTLPVRRFMLANVCNRMEEVLILHQKLQRHDAQ